MEFDSKLEQRARSNNARKWWRKIDKGVEIYPSDAHAVRLAIGTALVAFFQRLNEYRHDIETHAEAEGRVTAVADCSGSEVSAGAGLREEEAQPSASPEHLDDSV